MSKLFGKRILGKYEVEYYECDDCESLQTETPYWLDEAYANNSLVNTDTGAAQRNLHNLAACLAISRLIKAKNVIDIGGGDGLLCRLLRDYSINCYVQDKYATPTYARGFTVPDFDVPNLIIGFEVLEHFPNPINDLENLFTHKPNALLLSTAIYTNQKEDWWYLVPESGQHVFFYSKKAMEMIAERFSYDLIISGGFFLFIKQTSIFEVIMAKLLLKEKVVRLLSALVMLLPAAGVWKDHLIQIEKSKSNMQ